MSFIGFDLSRTRPPCNRSKDFTPSQPPQPPMANHPQPHHSRLTKFFGILLAIGTSIGTSGAATIFLEDTLDLETSSFIDGRDPVTRATVSSTGGGTPFIVDFSGLGETVISYTWKAPAGQRFVVTPPTGSSSFSIDLGFSGVQVALGQDPMWITHLWSGSAEHQAPLKQPIIHPLS